MRKILFFGFLILMGAWGGRAFAQGSAALRFAALSADSLVVRIDTLSILPESFRLSGLDTSEYEIDFISATVRLRDSALLGRPFTCSYRVFSIDYSQPLAHKSTDLVLPRLVADPTQSQYLSLAAPASGALFDSQLQGNGSVSRSVSVGNNQNFVLDANLNLQLSGFLAPDLEVIANITDENLPLQPEGNTRYIKDFNKVFIQLKYKELLRLEAGDVELSSPDNSSFFRVSRQFLGLKFRADTPIDSANRVINQVGGGVTKGKYVRNVITAIHGVQGPYKLSGEQNETNIVVLSGSEMVYLDGQLLTRGQDNDYVIDYNLGELTFTSKHLISSENRIIVTFEYSDQYYARYNLYTYNRFVHEKNSRVVLDVNFFHEQDLKRQSIMPELDNEQMLFLSHIGDQHSEAQYATAVPVTEVTGNEVLYLRIDTIVNGAIYTPVYVYAGGARDSVYRVTFSYVGSHSGDYILSQSTANGKLYRWVAPVDGVAQGDYAPVQLLNTPKQRDLASVGATFSTNKGLQVRSEVAFSYADDNLFSKIDDSDNAGIAALIGIDYQTRVRNRRRTDSLWRYQLNLEYEYLHQNFTPLETFREIEFSREFNLDSDYSSNTSEQMLKFSTGFSHPSKGSTLYSLEWLSRAGDVNTVRNAVNVHHQLSGWGIHTNTSFLISHDQVQLSRFLKSVSDFSRRFKKVVIGVGNNLEYNVFRSVETQQLRANSYAFNELSAYVANSDSSRCTFSFRLKNRIDDLLRDNVLALNSIANEAIASMEFNQWRHNRLKFSAIYRNDQLRDSSRHFNPEHNFVGSIDYAGRFWKGALSLNLYYETGSGLEQKKTFSYLKVAAGQGTHVWFDYNQNGIEELDEFEVAAFQNEADYVKIWLSTNDYVNTTNNAFSASLQLRPANLWRSKKGFLGFLAKLSNTTSLRTSQKNTLENIFLSVNPFHLNVPDSSLVAQTLAFRNNLAFALPSNYFAAEYAVQCNQAANLLYYGLESSRLTSHQVSLRTSPIKILIVKTVYVNSFKQNDAQYWESRRYAILSHTLDNSLSINLKCGFSLTALWSMSYRFDRLSATKANLYQARLDADYRIRERGSLRLTLQYINALCNKQDAISSLSYELLDGLSAGNNFLWDLSFQTKLFEYLQLSLLYQGRVTHDNRLIHTGSLQLKAMF